MCEGVPVSVSMCECVSLCVCECVCMIVSVCIRACLYVSVGKCLCVGVCLCVCATECGSVYVCMCVTYVGICICVCVSVWDACTRARVSVCICTCQGGWTLLPGLPPVPRVQPQRGGQPSLQVRLEGNPGWAWPALLGQLGVPCTIKAKDQSLGPCAAGRPDSICAPLGTPFPPSAIRAEAVGPGLHLEVCSRVRAP